MRVVVFYGGDSTEREVSLCSGARVCEALRERGHMVMGIDTRATAPDGECLALAGPADAVFLGFHGGAGEDGTWQAALERAGIFHYTGSDARASLLAMDKPRAKMRVKAFGVPCAKDAMWRVGEACPMAEFPFVIKPCAGGSSVGLHIVRNAEEREKIMLRTDMMCESYLAGREYTVGILQGRALPPVEICPQGGIYDYEHKYTQGATREICPAALPPTRLAELQDLALICFAALGLRDFARIDFKEDARGVFHFLEANTLPGMTTTSLLPLAASTRGISFGELCERMTKFALDRKKRQRCLTTVRKKSIII